MREKAFINIPTSIVQVRFFETIYSFLKEGDCILDIGTGNGYVLREIQKKKVSNLSLYGIDNSIEMLKKAQKYSDNIKYMLCDNYKINFDDSFFDMVVAKNVTRFSANEIYRVLKPGGVFIYREYGKYKGMVEIGRLFEDRLIRSRNKSFYDHKLIKAGFDVLNSDYVGETKTYVDINSIIDIIHSFPMIDNFNEQDEKVLRKIYANKKDIKIDSDAFLAVYMRKK